MRLSPYRELIWCGGIKGIFFGEYVFKLLPLEQGLTRMVHREEFSSIAIPFALHDAIEEGYPLMNKALKVRAETGHPLCLIITEQPIHISRPADS